MRTLKVLKRKAVNIDDKVAIPLDPKDLGRIAIGAARNTIRQGIRTGEKVRHFQNSRASSANLLQLLLKELTLRAVRQLSE